MSRETFSDAVDRALKRSGLSQAEVAEKAEVSAALVSNWAKGKVATPDPSLVFAVERALGLEAGSLSRHLGFLPATESVGAEGVEAAVERDQSLTALRRDLFLALYRELRDEPYGDTADKPLHEKINQAVGSDGFGDRRPPGGEAPGPRPHRSRRRPAS